jgi:hypothetical protein
MSEGILYPPIELEEGRQITLNLVNGMGATGIIMELDYTEDRKLRAIGIQDDPEREDLLWLRGDLIAAWRMGPGVPVAQPQPVGTILVPAGPVPNIDGRRR